jgi:hypothetical protein
MIRPESSEDKGSELYEMMDQVQMWVDKEDK